MGFLGNGTSATALYAAWSGDGNSYIRVNCVAGAGQGVAAAGTVGHFVASRTSSTQLNGYKNKTSVLSNASDASAAVANYNIYTIGCNNNGTPAGNVRQQCSMSIGSGLTSGDVTSYYDLLRAWMTTVGVP